MKKIQALAVKEDNVPFRVIQVNGLRDQLNGLPNGKYRLTVERYTRKASHSQYKYLYGIVYPLSLLALNDAGYEFTNVDQVDLWWKSLFANKEILNRETGEIIKLPLTKSEFSTTDEMAYCDQIRTYCSEYLGTYIPEPNERNE
jgi:hypothetical protein